MLRAVVTSARLIAVHNPIVAADLARSFDARVETIRLGVRDPFGTIEAGERMAARLRTRERLGMRPDSFVILAYGGITPEKRIAAATRALAALRTHGDVRLMLVGGVAPDYDPVADARAAGVADRVAVTGFVSNSDIPAYLLAADVALALRWPTARETSAAWAECLAAGLPTMLSDLAHLAHVPTLSVRDWRPPPAADPIAIAVDLFDEEQILIRGLRRLMADQTLRERLGRAARAYFEAHHTVSGMVADYLGAIDAGAMRSAPGTELPAHLRPDPLAHARHLAAAVGVDLSMQ
jgi:glycosyltransferase involved in cell wall biosynthesis